MLNNINGLNYQKFKAFVIKILVCLFLLFFAFSIIIENYVDASVIETEETPMSYVVDTVPDTMLNLDDSVNLSSSVHFPSIGSQQGGSCVAWAIAYYQFTYQVAEKEKLNAKDFNNVYSPKYVWNYLNDGVNQGISITKCYDFIKQNGCLKWSEFPQSGISFDWYSNNDHDEMLDVLHNALDYKIDNYYETRFIESQTTAPLITSNDSEYIYQMKRRLSQENKLLCVNIFMGGAKLGTLPAGNGTMSGQYVVKYTETHPTSHFITLVGYNDNIYYDLNGDGQRQAFEYGAFLAADSRGADFSGRNNGYIWIMYDALNKTSNATNLNTQNRSQGILDNTYWYIEVKKCEPKLTVEVTVTQRERDEFVILLMKSDNLSQGCFGWSTFAEGIGGNRNFDGSPNSNETQSYTFVFDYEAYNLPVDDGYHYGVRIKDLNSNDGKNTVVQKIVWKDKNGTKIKEIAPNESINGNSKDYYATLEKISIQQDNTRIRKGRTITPNVVVEPFDLNFSYTLASSDSSKITVNGNQITAVEEGYANITATAVLANGKTLTASCHFDVYESFGDSRNNATAVEINTEMSGEMVESTDVSWLKFTPSENGIYMFCVQGSQRMMAELYTGNTATPSNTGTFSGGLLIISKQLIKNQTYYIKLYNVVGNADEYRLCVVSNTFKLINDNPDARHIQLKGTVSSLYNTLDLTIDGQTFSLQKANTSLQTFANTSIKYKVTVNAGDFYTEWTVDMDVSSANSYIGVEKSISYLFKNDTLRIESPFVETEFFAYKTFLKSNVYGQTLDSVIAGLNADLPQNAYTFSAYSASGSVITNTSSTKAATGMVILKKDAQLNKITEVYHLVVIGDTQGDGNINNLDASLILKYDAGTGTITGVYFVAADANQDGNVNNLDSTLVLRYDAGLSDINQILTNTEVPDDIYFGEPVAF